MTFKLRQAGDSGVLLLEYSDIDGESSVITFFSNELNDLTDAIENFKDMFVEKEKEDMGF